MSKHGWQLKDWIIYHNDGEEGQNIKCCAVGSQEASHVKGIVIRGFYGTYPEVKRLVEDLNSEVGQKFLRRRHYVRKDKI